MTAINVNNLAMHYAQRFVHATNHDIGKLYNETPEDVVKEVERLDYYFGNNFKATFETGIVLYQDIVYRNGPLPNRITNSEG